MKKYQEGTWGGGKSGQKDLQNNKKKKKERDTGSWFTKGCLFRHSWFFKLFLM